MMMMKLFLLLNFASCLATSLEDSSDHQDRPPMTTLLELLTKKTFSVSSTVLRESFRTVLDEHYSYAQSRAYIASEDGDEEFHYDAGSMARSFVIVNKHSTSKTRTCSQAYRDVFNEKILGLNSPLFALFAMTIPDNETTCDETKLRHMIGPARLIFQIPLLFKLNKCADNGNFSGTVKYTGSANALSVSVYYHSVAGQTDDIDLMDTLPARVEISWQDKKLWKSRCMVEFHGLKIYQSSSIIETSSRTTFSGRANTDLSQDKFLFPIACGCSQHLKPIELNSNFLIASFQVELASQVVRFVAIDQLAQVYRVDERDVSDIGRGSRVRIYDIKQNRNYLIVEGGQGSECIATLIGDRRQELLGSSPVFGANKFTYMGDSLVDGARAQVWEGLTNYLPFWLDMPELVQTKSHGFVPRVHGQAMQSWHEDLYFERMFSIVIYSAGNGLSRQLETWPNILLVQIYSFDIEQKKPSDLLHEVRLYQFAHELTDTPDHGRATSIFVPRSCFKPDTNIGTSVEMILGVPPAIGWLEVARKRNQAIKTALSLPSTMICNLESVLMHQNDSVLNLIVKFDLIEPLPDTRFISFAGNVKLNQYNPADVHPASSPIECLSMFKLANKILYDENSRSCIPDPVDDSMEYVDVPTKSSELFNIRREPDSAMAKAYKMVLQFFSTPINRLELISRDYDQTVPDIVSALVKEIKLTRGDDPAAHPEGQVAFPGITFDENKLATKKRVKPSIGNQLTYSDCDTACLQDLACQTFSYCSSSTESICILADLSLQNAADIQLQLTKLKIWQMADGQQLQVNLSDGSILHLLHKSHCQLEKKVFTDFYLVPPMAAQNYDLNFLQINKTQTPSECARLCFERNQNTIKLINENNLKLMQLLHSNTDADTLNTEILIVKDQRDSLAKQFCIKFMFLDESISEEELKRLTAFLHVPVKDESPYGYCALNKGHSDETYERGKAIFKFASYKFDFSRLYITKRDVILTSSLNKEEQNAFKSLDDESLATKDSLDIMKRAIASGKNFQIHRGGLNLVECSKLCFSQPKVLWPACVSFDHSLKGHQENCYLNSVNWTSPDAIAAGSSESIDTQQVHYEPIFISIQLDTDHSEEAQHGKSGWFVLVTISLVLAGIGCGCYIIAPRLEPRVANFLKLNGRVDPDVASLISWQPNQELNAIS